MQATPPPAIQVSLSDRLIGELPRFFGGRLAALREVFQNAFRAGARHLEFSIEGLVLTIQDDGAGCPDPQVLLSAGSTGWDESQVVEPAGLGFFSLLSNDVASAVEVQSCGWRVNLVAAHVLAKKPVRVEPGEVQRGMRLRLILARSERLVEDIREARAYYPFAVTMDGEDVPVTKWNPTWEIQTPVGRVGIGPRVSASHTAIWEHRDVEGDAFHDSLSRAAQGLQAVVASEFSFHWVVEPASGVTPKLPDRNNLNDNVALSAASTIILDCALAHLRERAREATKDWPDELPETITTPTWLLRSDTGHALLAELGWRAAERREWADKKVRYNEHEGWNVGNATRTVLTKHFLEVDDDDVAESINCAKAMGAALPWAVASPGGAQARITGRAKPRTEEPPYIGLCREIRIGKHRLPFLLLHDEPGDVLLACDADTAIAALQGQAVQLPGLAGGVANLLEGYLVATNTEQLYDAWGDYDGDPTVNWTQVNVDLVEQVSNDFIGGRRARARQALHRLEAEQKTLADAEARIAQMADRPSVRALTKAVARVGRTLAAEHENLRKAAELPA